MIIISKYSGKRSKEWKMVSKREMEEHREKAKSKGVLTPYERFKNIRVPRYTSTREKISKERRDEYYEEEVRDLSKMVKKLPVNPKKGDLYSRIVKNPKIGKRCVIFVATGKKGFGKWKILKNFGAWDSD